MDAIVASLPATIVADLVRLGPREAAESVASFLARETASGSTLFAETVAPLIDPTGPASKSARRAAEFKARARDAFARSLFTEAFEHLTTALTFAPDDARRAAPRGEESIPSRASTPTPGSLRNDRAAVLLRLAAERLEASSAEPTKNNADEKKYDATVKTFARLALRDASVAAAINPECVKARLRMGVAARALEEIETASGAFRDALGLLSETNPARASIETRLAEAEKANKRTRSGEGAVSEAKAFRDTSRVTNETNETVKQVAVRLTPDAGLGVFNSSSTSIEPGDVVLNDEPAVASVPAKQSRKTRCHFCHRFLSDAPTPCRECSVSIYCDENCRDSDVAHNTFECSENSPGCWWSVLPAETRLAMRCIFFSAGAKYDEGKKTRVSALHRRWADFDADARARLAATAAVASHCVTRGRADLSEKDYSPGAVLEATCAVLGNAFAVKASAHPSFRVASASVPDPQSAEVTRLANLVNALDANRNPTHAAYLDAWRVLSEEAHPVALTTFAETSRLNHSCDPNAHVEIFFRPTKNSVAGRASNVHATTRATRRCSVHEELRVSYGPVLGSAPRDARRERLRASHGFFCACGGCLRDAEDERGDTSGDDDEVNTWDGVIDDARASFISCDAEMSARAPDSEQKKHLRLLEGVISSMRARTNGLRDDERKKASLFQTRKALAEALDARALGLVTVAAKCHAHRRREAAFSAREALNILINDLGYPEEDSLTVALERARVAALEMACDDASNDARVMDDLRRARVVLTAALGGGSDDGDASVFRELSLAGIDSDDSSSWSALEIIVDGSLERRALFVVDALIASRSETGGALYELD